MSGVIVGRCGVTEKLYEAVGGPMDFDATVLECRVTEDGRFAAILLFSQFTHIS